MLSSCGIGDPTELVKDGDNRKVTFHSISQLPNPYNNKVLFDELLEILVQIGGFSAILVF
jgi:hypothetical protein